MPIFQLKNLTIEKIISGRVGDEHFLVLFYLDINKCLVKKRYSSNETINISNITKIKKAVIGSTLSKKRHDVLKNIKKFLYSEERIVVSEPIQESISNKPEILYFLTDNIKLANGRFNANFLSLKDSISKNNNFAIVDYKTNFKKEYLKNKILVFDFTSGFGMKIVPTKKEINHITPYLKYSKKNIAILHDLHGKKSFNKNIDILSFFKKNNFKLILYGHACETPEHKLFLNNNLKYKNIFHHINFDVFQNLNLTKKYDIIFIGELARWAYPFRYRLYHLLKDHFNVVYVNKKPHNYLVEKINESHLGVITPSKFNYFLQKNIEVPLCNCCPLGNLPQNNTLANELYQNDYVKLNTNMSDNEIINVVRTALEDKKKLQEKSGNIRNRIANFDSKNYSTALLNACKNI